MPQDENPKRFDLEDRTFAFALLVPKLHLGMPMSWKLRFHSRRTNVVAVGEAQLRKTGCVPKCNLGTREIKKVVIGEVNRTPPIPLPAPSSDVSAPIS
jgi:hypothetical protein